MSECGPLVQKNILLLVLATPGMDPAQTDWSEFSAELSTAEPLENRKIKQDNLLLSVCLSVNGDKKKCVTLAVCVQCLFL